MLNISPADFKNLLLGVSAIVTEDQVGTPQCVDVAQLWARVLGYPRFTGNAKDIYSQAGENYIQIPNTPDAVPQAGDIPVWDGKYNAVNDVDGDGHVGVATGNGDTNSFEAVVQNDPLKSDIEVKTYSYDHVIGWLRPKQLPQDQQATMDQLRNDRDKNWNLYQAALQDVSGKESTIQSLNDTITTKNQQIANQQTDIQNLQTQVTNLTTQLESSQLIAKQVPGYQKIAQQAESDRQKALDANATLNKEIIRLQNLRPQGFWNKVLFLLEN